MSQDNNELFKIDLPDFSLGDSNNDLEKCLIVVHRNLIDILEFIEDEKLSSPDSGLMSKTQKEIVSHIVNILEKIRYIVSFSDHEQVDIDQLRSLSHSLEKFENYLWGLVKSITLHPSNPTLLVNHIEKIRSNIQDFKALITLQDERVNDIDPSTTRGINHSINEMLKEAESKIHAKTSQLNVFISDIAAKNEVLSSDVAETLSKTNDLYVTTQKELEVKKQNISDVLTDLSSSKLASSYGESAITEGKAADKFRELCLYYMLFVAIVTCGSLYQVVEGDLSLHESIVRLFFSIILTIPGAYLARESAKHRQQKYFHLQMALDIKAIDPYLGTITESVLKNELKAEFAKRLFCQNTSAGLGKDSYPINAQELLIKMMDTFKPDNNKSEPQEDKSK